MRSSATAEDLPRSFAGQQESSLDVRGPASVREAVSAAFASLFTPRAIGYRLDTSFDQMQVALSAEREWQRSFDVFEEADHTPLFTAAA